jgi:hypothetical protein
MQFIHLGLLSFLVALTSASPTDQYDGTLDYFNKVYRPQNDMEESPETEMHTNSHNTEPKHVAKVGLNGIQSKIHTTMRGAKKEAIRLYLMQKGGEVEVRRVCIFKFCVLPYSHRE